MAVLCSTCLSTLYLCIGTATRRPMRKQDKEEADGVAFANATDRIVGVNDRFSNNTHGTSTEFLNDARRFAITGTAVHSTPNCLRGIFRLLALPTYCTTLDRMNVDMVVLLTLHSSVARSVASWRHSKCRGDFMCLSSICTPSH